MSGFIKSDSTDVRADELQKHAKIETYIEFIVAAAQLPRFLIVRKPDGEGYTALTDPLYDALLRKWVSMDVPSPSQEMNEFVYSLACALNAELYRNENLTTMSARGFSTSRWVTDRRIQTMTDWMTMTPVSEIAILAASWMRMIDARKEIDEIANRADEDVADLRAALAWKTIQTSPHGQSFCLAYGRALLMQTTNAGADGVCGLRPL